MIRFFYTFDFNLVHIFFIMRGIMNKKFRQISDDEIKSIILDILIDVKSFNEEHNLRYTLYYGTLLGAIRHKGYIPWDVDMDIVMPRPDYEYFLENYVPKNKNITMFDEKHCDFYHFAWAKICDNRTVCDEHYRGYKNNPYGIYFDIFPIDGINVDKDLKKKQMKAKRLMEMSCLARFKPSSFFPFHYNIGLVISTLLFGWSVNSIKLRDKLVALCKEVDYDSTDDLMIMANGAASVVVIKKEWIEDTMDATFEGIPCKISKHYDVILKKIYGDYMTLPPENKRKDNHTYNDYHFINN